MYEEAVARSFFGDNAFNGLPEHEKDQARQRASVAISTYLTLTQGEKIACGRLHIHTAAENIGRAWLDDKEIEFSPKEYELLRHFMLRQGQMLSKKSILREVWGPAHVDSDEYLRVFIGQLRKKLPGYIVTKAQVGYMLCGPKN